MLSKKELFVCLPIFIFFSYPVFADFKLENISYPQGQKVLVGIEGGRIENGIKVRLLKDGKPKAGERISFRVMNSSATNASVTDTVLTDENGVASATFEIGSHHGNSVIAAFYNNSIETPPVNILVSAYKKGWIYLLVLGLLGGLSIFLFGMDMSAEGLQKAAGDKMRIILGKLTNKPIMGVLVGTLTTAAIQSSSATTVMVVGFVSATLMTLPQAIGVIYGANIGTTLTVQLIAFNVSEYSPLMIAVGFALSLFASKSQALKFLGMIIMGFGFIFFGMGMMSESMNPLRSVAWFTELLASLGTSPIKGVLFSTIFTAIIQSSGAVIGISIALATQGILSLPAAIVISFGANIGTCATALLSSIGSSREGKRVALVHLMFNTIGVILFLPFVNLFTEFIQKLSSVLGTASVSRSIANAHMFFNIINTVIFIPFTGRMAWLVEKLIPVPPKEKVQEFKPIYLVGDIKTATIALEQTRREVLRFGEICKGMVESTVKAWDQSKGNDLPGFIAEEFRKSEILTKALHEYLGELSRKELSNQESREAAYYLHVVDDLKHINDTIYRDFGSVVDRERDLLLALSEDEKNDLNIYQGHTLELLQKNLASIEQIDIKFAEEANLLYNKLKRLASKLQDNNITRSLSAGKEKFSVFADIMDALRAISSRVNILSHSILEHQE